MEHAAGAICECRQRSAKRITRARTNPAARIKKIKQSFVATPNTITTVTAPIHDERMQTRAYLLISQLVTNAVIQIR